MLLRVNPTILRCNQLPCTEATPHRIGKCMEKEAAMGMPRTLAHCISQVMRLGVFKEGWQAHIVGGHCSGFGRRSVVNGCFWSRQKKTILCLNLEVECSRGVSISLPNRWDGCDWGIRLTPAQKKGYHRPHLRIRLRHAERQKPSKNIKTHQKTKKNQKLFPGRDTPKPGKPTGKAHQKSTQPADHEQAQFIWQE